MNLSKNNMLSLLLFFGSIKIVRILCYGTILKTNNFIEYKHVMYDMLISSIVYYVICKIFTITIHCTSEVFLFDTLATTSLLCVYLHLNHEENRTKMNESFAENEAAKRELNNYQQRSNQAISTLLAHKPTQAEIVYPNRSIVYAIIATPYYLLVV